MSNLFDPKKMVKRLRSVLEAFLPPEATEMLNLLNDPAELEPLLRQGFTSLFRSLEIPPEHIQFAMGYNPVTDLMEYRVRVYNRHIRQWKDIPFPAAQFLSCLFMESERDLVIEGVKKMILIFYHYNPDSGKVAIGGKEIELLQLNK